MARRRSYWSQRYPRYTPASPREAKNGIKARSKRGDIGETWWSRHFVEALEAFTDHNRMGRGRRYARSGQVMDLTVEPGMVASRVQGSRSAPYRVVLTFEPLSDDDWTRAEQAMADQAVFLASLLAGEMPQDIEDAFSSCDLGLFPASSTQLHTDCTCPDWANPCKHIAATYYILAEQFDEDPFLIFAWRGRHRDELLVHLRELRGGGGDRSAPSTGEFTSARSATEPLDPEPARFWRAGPGLDELRFDVTRPDHADSILQEIGRAPRGIAGLDLSERLSRVYLRMVEVARRKAET